MSYKLSPVTNGNFLSTETQPYTGLTSGQTITFNSQVISMGISLSGTTKLVVTSNGYYKFDISAIGNQTSGSGFEYDIWFSLDGSQITNSNTKIIIANATSEVLITVPFIIYMLPNQYVELQWYCSSANGRLLATAAGTNPTRPVSPSIICSVVKISE